MQQQELDIPSLDSVFNLNEFEVIASKTLPNPVHAYYSSAADDEVSHRQNRHSIHRIFFKPKILVDVTDIDLSSKMLGEIFQVPFYISATALCGLGNPSGGEIDMVKACGRTEFLVPQMISTFSSGSLNDIAAAKANEKQTQWFQLYVNGDRRVTHNLIKKAEDLGLKALFITVDAPQAGNRERDLRFKFSSTNKKGPHIMRGSKTPANGTSGALSKLIDTTLTWKDIEHFKTLTNLPIILKGVQRTEDIITAAEIGCKGVVLSNHGGRQLDFSIPPIEVLAESVPVLKNRGLDKNFDILIDGGFRRGTDILKALCLGASGVGMASPFLYANSVYGQAGVEKAFDIIINELELSMKLLGVTKISELTRDLVDLRGL
ncbi:AEG_G0014010.mRNA.1.CDS.1 [Saccharomyces cerevisiae]|nr:CNB_1a_G0013720.mRNA.1.CDS.1 [Saccharomyces cerevisiae]CAI4388653.1 AEG_G0014010.mRNA.1.CDS.1 [Saccharomyces cerevisiae]CAI6445886.1 CNT_HP1_G0012270.mRNA.1.CDS.1 [Saccharomyces cerevisiae]CAI6595629.1 AEG_G0014010.mRNA.1.CDS.1 [Saccharomyces cerevisiae]CAI7232512.1 CNB_1a_G0013720.mRNA.1.CDS.1 [Saccharomyces cerevisiae]